ncbi:MAG: hypothetical protein ABF289_09550 [Clostridiales bacterium]
MGKSNKLIAVLFSALIVLSIFTCFVIKNRVSTREYKIKETKEVTKIIFVTEKKPNPTLVTYKPTQLITETMIPTSEPVINDTNRNRTKKPSSNLSNRTVKFYNYRLNDKIGANSNIK